MKSFDCVVRAAVGAALLLLCACASGPTYSQWNATAPKLAADKGRVFIYREDTWVAAANHPSMYIDNVKVGDAVPGGFIFVDVTPGPHVFSSWPQELHRVNFSVAAGGTVYVKFVVTGPNLQLDFPTPMLVEKDVGEAEVKESLYIGK